MYKWFLYFFLWDIILYDLNCCRDVKTPTVIFSLISQTTFVIKMFILYMYQLSVIQFSCLLLVLSLHINYRFSCPSVLLLFVCPITCKYFNIFLVTLPIYLSPHIVPVLFILILFQQKYAYLMSFWTL